MADLNEIAASPDVLGVEVTDITLKKHRNTETLSLFPQFRELNIYQSLFSPIQKAELVLHDPISLLVNFPMVGEETLEIILKPSRNNPSSVENSDQTDRQQSNVRIRLQFMVSDLRQLYPDDKARSMLYVLDLWSIEMYHNSKWRVQRAFKDQYHNVAKTILKDYLEVDKDISTSTSNSVTISNYQKIKDTSFEETKGIIPIVVPNLRPLDAISWLAKRSVATDEKHHNYHFFENFDGFHFKTIQKMAEVVNSKSYVYFSNMTPAQRQRAAGGKLENLDQWTITALAQNKRYSTSEKHLGGFYENEYYEIDIFNKRVNNKQTSVPDKPKNPIGKDYAQLNTLQYLKDALTNNDRPGTKTRVRYAIGQNGGDDPDFEHHWSEKFGEATRSQLAYSQIAVTVAAPGHTGVQAGDTLEIMIPELHGFNIVEEDRYVSGRYIVTNIKHSISLGMRHIMVMDLSRDSYTNDIELKMKYNLDVGK